MLSWADHGSGEAVVLLHGIPGSRETWRDLIALLSPHARLFVPDLLGFGQSPEGTPVPHAFEQAEAVLEMLSATPVREVHLVGFDFGGPVSIALFQLAPQRVKTLTLIATNLLSDTPIPVPLQIARVPYVGELTFRLMFSRPGLAMLWRVATANRDAFPLERLRAACDARGISATRRIFVESLRRMKEFYGPIEDELPRVDVPVTVVWGDRDPFFPIAVGERTAKRFPAARFVRLDHCGHFVPNERARLLAAIIAENLAPNVEQLKASC